MQNEKILNVTQTKFMFLKMLELEVKAEGTLTMISRSRIISACYPQR